MKRTPLSIITDLLLALNCLLLDKEYSINALAEFSNLHWETTNRHLELIKKIQDFSPSLLMTSSNKIKLVKKNHFLDIEDDDLILLYSLQNQATDGNSAIEFPNSMNLGIEFLVSKNFGHVTNDNKFFLNERGKNMALDAYLEIQEKINSVHPDSTFILNSFCKSDDKTILEDLEKFESLAEKISQRVCDKIEALYTQVESGERDIVAQQYLF